MYKYILFKPYPNTPIQVVGSALHFLAKRFFDPRVTYKSPESFAGVWKGFWMGVVKGEHGPEGYGTKPVHIVWSFPEEQWVWFNKGQEVLKAFFERNADFRQTGIGVRREQRFRVRWHGFTLGGVVDRLDVIGPLVRVVDYKMGKIESYMLLDSMQGTIYQIAYDEALRSKRVFNGRPLGEIKIENLLSGKISDMPLRDEAQVARLHRLLMEASAYVRGVLTGVLPPPFAVSELEAFRAEHIRDRTFKPRLPRGAHCKYCNFVPDCREWERANERPTSASLWVARNAEQRRIASVGFQLDLDYTKS